MREAPGRTHLWASPLNLFWCRKEIGHQKEHVLSLKGKCQGWFLLASLQERPGAGTMTCEGRGPGPLSHQAYAPGRRLQGGKLRQGWETSWFLAVAESMPASLTQIHISCSFSFAQPEFSKSLLFLGTKDPELSWIRGSSLAVGRWTPHCTHSLGPGEQAASSA